MRIPQWSHNLQRQAALPNFLRSLPLHRERILKPSQAKHKYPHELKNGRCYTFWRETFFWIHRMSMTLQQFPCHLGLWQWRSRSLERRRRRRYFQLRNAERIRFFHRRLFESLQFLNFRLSRDQSITIVCWKQIFVVILNSIKKSTLKEQNF